MMTHQEYGEAYQREFRKTVRLLQSRGASPDHAEDLAQGAWLQGWRMLDQLRERRALLGWINTIALNYHRRIGAFESRFEPLLERATGSSSDFASLDVAKVLQICSPRQRRLFEHQLRGLTMREIAAKQGATEAAIRIRCLRARRDVREGLNARAAALREVFRDEEASVTAA